MANKILRQPQDKVVCGSSSRTFCASVVECPRKSSVK